MGIHYHVEILESRRLLVAVEWDGGGDGTNWFDAANWSNNQVPSANDDVTVSVAGSPLIRVGQGIGDAEVKTLVLDETLHLVAPLRVIQSADLNAEIRFNHNTGIIGGICDVADARFVQAPITEGSGGFLEGVQLVGTFRMSGFAQMRFGAGTTFQGIELVGNSGLMLRPGTMIQHDVTLNGQYARLSLTSAGTLNIAAGASVHGGGLIGDNAAVPNAAAMTLVNAGEIYSTASGQFSLQVLPASWSNTGIIESRSGGLTLGGSWQTASMGTIKRTGGSLAFSGQWNNSGREIVVGQNLNGASIAGATITGGSLRIMPGFALDPFSSPRLRDVTVLSPLTVANSIELSGTTRFVSITVTGGTLQLAGGYMLLDTVFLEGNAEIRAVNGVSANLGNGSTVVLRGEGVKRLSAGPFVNFGRIIVDDPATLVYFEGASFVNEASLEIRRGRGSFNTPLTNRGTIAVDAGATLELRANSTHDSGGSIRGAGKTVIQFSSHTFGPGQFLSYGELQVLDPAQVTFNGLIQATPILFAGTVNVNFSQTLPPNVTIGGTFGGTGDVTLTGDVQFRFGKQTGTGKTIIAPNATLDMRQVGGHIIYERVLENHGLIDMRFTNLNSPGGRIEGGRWINQEDGVMLIARAEIYTGVSTGAIENHGRIEFSGNTDQRILYTRIENHGQFLVTEGRLELGCTGLTTKKLMVADGAWIEFGGAFEFAPNTGLIGGNVSFAGGTIDFTGSQFLPSGRVIFSQEGPLGPVNVTIANLYPNDGLLAVNAGARVNFDVDVTFTTVDSSGGGQLGGRGSVTVTQSLQGAPWFLFGQGALVIDTGASAQLRSFQQHYLRKPLINHGTLTISDRLIIGQDSAGTGSLTNATGGVINLSRDIVAESPALVPGFTNDGVVNVTSDSRFGDLKIRNSGIIQSIGGVRLTMESEGENYGQIAVPAQVSFHGTWFHAPGSSVNTSIANLNGGSHQFFGTLVAGTLLSLSNDASVTFHTSPSTNTLELIGASTLNLARGGFLSLRSSSVSLAPASSIDLADNAIVVDYPSITPRSQIASMLTTGYANGAWNGKGIFSSVAATTPGQSVGFAEATDLFDAFPATFRGTVADASSIVIGFSPAADANLDGIVSFNDFSRTAAGFGNPESRWSRGDFNYSGATDSADIAILSNAIGGTVLAVWRGQARRFPSGIDAIKTFLTSAIDDIPVV